MDDTKLRSAILIVSDTAYADPSADRSGSILQDTFSSQGGEKWETPITKIVPDDALEIQRTLQEWSDTANSYNLIVTSGGTGFAVKDNTPEVGDYVFKAVSALLHRHAPGLV
ncbi:MAG: hypothetical protein Q9160_000696 [Pyrenula sp. 1 TL-2023]